MKISYRTHEILDKFNKGTLGKLPVYEDDYNFITTDFKYRFHNGWKDHICNFKEQINIITNPFRDASDLASKKLADLYVDILKNDTSDICTSGTFFFNNFIYNIHHSVKKGSEDFETYFYMFTDKMIPICMLIHPLKPMEFSSTEDTSDIFWVSKAYGELDGDESYGRITSEIVKIVMFDMFKNYAQVETKYLPPKKTIREMSAKYINETNHGVTILDSKWFTNLVKSDSFKVRGHFRLQPKKKNGEWTKEIIWISDFVKNGYTSKAKILDQCE